MMADLWAWMSDDTTVLVVSILAIVISVLVILIRSLQEH